jgi:hypothetical protein
MSFDPEEVRALFTELTGGDNVWDASVMEKVRHEASADEASGAMTAEGCPFENENLFNCG